MQRSSSRAGAIIARGLYASFLLSTSGLISHAAAQETWWGDNFNNPCNAGLGLTASCVVALSNPTPGGVGYIAGSGQVGAINLTRFSTTGTYIDAIHIFAGGVGGGAMEPVSIEEMVNHDLLVAARFTPSGAGGPNSVTVARINPSNWTVVNSVTTGALASSGRIVAREMSNGSVTLCARASCANSGAGGDFPRLQNWTLLPTGAAPTLNWTFAYQAAAGDTLSFNDFREKTVTGGQNTIVVVGGLTPQQSIGAIPAIAEVNAVTGVIIGSIHTYDAAIIGGGAFDRITITPTGWYAAASESILSFPNSISRLRMTKFTTTAARAWERTWSLGMVSTGIATMGTSPPVLFVGGSHAGGNLGYLAIFSPTTGAFGGCQTFNSGGTESFADMVLDSTSPSPLPVLAGRYNATPNNTGTNYGYFVRTAANGTTPCSSPVFPSEVTTFSTHGTATFTLPPPPGGGPLCVGTIVYAPPTFFAQASACVTLPGGSGPPPWAYKVCGPCAGQCGLADVGGAGGLAMICGDGTLDNNDFVAFINHFFAGDAAADLGSQGGEAGADGHFDNNDFIAFINDFFTGC